MALGSVLSRYGNRSFRITLVFILVLISMSLVSQSGPFLAYADTTTWAKSYGGLGDDGRMNVVHSVQQTSDGGYIVASTTRSFGAGELDAWLLKLDSDGNVEWEKAYGGTSVDTAASVQQTSDGGYIAAGRTISFGAGDNDLWLLKLDSDGNVEWEKAYGGTGFDEANSVQQTSDGGYIAAGSTFEDAWLLKLDSDGNVEWEKAYGGSNGEAANSVQQTSDGGYIAAGHTFSFGAGGDAWLLKLDSDGNVEWEKAYGGSNGEAANSVQQTSDGGYIAAGSTFEDAWLLKLDSDGNVEWEKAYGGTSFDTAFSVQQTSDGGYIAAGTTDSFGAGALDLWLLKLDSEGNIDNCIDDVTVQDTNASIEDTQSEVTDTNSTKTDTEADVNGTNAEVEDTNAEIDTQCSSLFPPHNYSLKLFENVNDPSDGVVDLNQTVRAVASTDDSSVDQITFRWINPSTEIAREITVPIATPEDTFAPDEPGDWIVEADFGNGQVVQKTLDIRFFVLPESPIGALAMVAASMGALGGFLYFRSRKPSVTN